jgi:hypothetical protein
MGMGAARLFKRALKAGPPTLWLCVQAVEFELPSGRTQVAPGTRFTRGARYMDMDLAQLLDEHYRLYRRG